MIEDYTIANLLNTVNIDTKSINNTKYSSLDTSKNSFDSVFQQIQNKLNVKENKIFDRFDTTKSDGRVKTSDNTSTKTKQDLNATDNSNKNIISDNASDVNPKKEIKDNTRKQDITRETDDSKVKDNINSKDENNDSKKIVDNKEKDSSNKQDNENAYLDDETEDTEKEEETVSANNLVGYVETDVLPENLTVINRYSTSEIGQLVNNSNNAKDNKVFDVALKIVSSEAETESVQSNLTNSEISTNSRLSTVSDVSNVTDVFSNDTLQTSTNSTIVLDSKFEKASDLKLDDVLNNFKKQNFKGFDFSDNSSDSDVKIEISQDNTLDVSQTDISQADVTDNAQTDISDILENTEEVVVDVAKNTEEDTVSRKDDKLYSDENLDMDNLISDVNEAEFHSEQQGSSFDTRQNAQEAMIKLSIENIDATDVAPVKTTTFTQTLNNVKNVQTVATKTTDTMKTDVMNQIKENISDIKGNMNSKVNIILKPEKLGKLSIEIMNTKDGVKASVIAQTPQVKEMLEKGIDSLKSTLASQGVNVNSVNIKVEETASSQQGSFNFDKEHLAQDFANSQGSKNEQNQTESSKNFTKLDFEEDEDSEVTEGSSDDTEADSVISENVHNGKVDISA